MGGKRTHMDRDTVMGLIAAGMAGLVSFLFVSFQVAPWFSAASLVLLGAVLAFFIFETSAWLHAAQEFENRFWTLAALCGSLILCFVPDSPFLWVIDKAVNGVVLPYVSVLPGLPHQMQEPTDGGNSNSSNGYVLLAKWVFVVVVTIVANSYNRYLHRVEVCREPAISRAKSSQFLSGEREMARQHLREVSTALQRLDHSIMPSTLQNMFNLPRVLHNERRILATLSEVSADHLNFIVTNVNLGLVLYKVKDHRWVRLDHRTELLRILATDRLQHLTVEAKARLLDAIQILKVRANEHAERLVQRIIESCRGDALSQLKCLTDTKGDWHSLHKLVYHDISSDTVRDAILHHIAHEARVQAAHDRLKTTHHSKRRQKLAWRKVLSDVDDTLSCSGGLYPAGIDMRYPRKTVYPGVLAFYRELDLGAHAEKQLEEMRQVTEREQQGDFCHGEWSQSLWHGSGGGGDGAATPAPASPSSAASSASSLASAASSSMFGPMGVTSLAASSSRGGAGGGGGAQQRQRWGTSSARSRQQSTQHMRSATTFPKPASFFGPAAASAMAKGPRATREAHAHGRYASEPLQQRVGMPWEVDGGGSGGSGNGGADDDSLSPLEELVSGHPVITRGPVWPAGRLGNLVFLSARPHIYADMSERRSYEKFNKLRVEKGLHTNPSLLAGSLETGGRYMWSQDVQPIAQKKLENLREYIALYPEFHHVFIGDNGQGDVAAAAMALQDPALRPHMKAVYMHLVQPIELTFGYDPARPQQWEELGIVFFHNYVDAAMHAFKTQLISAQGLRRVTEQAVWDWMHLRWRSSSSASAAATTAAANATVTAAAAAATPATPTRRSTAASSAVTRPGSALGRSLHQPAKTASAATMASVMGRARSGGQVRNSSADLRELEHKSSREQQRSGAESPDSTHSARSASSSSSDRSAHSTTVGLRQRRAGAGVGARPGTPDRGTVARGGRGGGGGDRTTHPASPRVGGVLGGLFSMRDRASSGSPSEPDTDQEGEEEDGEEAAENMQQDDDGAAADEEERKQASEAELPSSGVVLRVREFPLSRNFSSRYPSSVSERTHMQWELMASVQRANALLLRQRIFDGLMSTPVPLPLFLPLDGIQAGTPVMTPMGCGTVRKFRPADGVYEIVLDWNIGSTMLTRSSASACRWKYSPIVAYMQRGDVVHRTSAAALRRVRDEATSSIASAAAMASAAASEGMRQRAQPLQQQQPTTTSRIPRHDSTSSMATLASASAMSDLESERSTIATDTDTDGDELTGRQHRVPGGIKSRRSMSTAEAIARVRLQQRRLAASAQLASFTYCAHRALPAFPRGARVMTPFGAGTVHSYGANHDMYTLLLDWGWSQAVHRRGYAGRKDVDTAGPLAVLRRDSVVRLLDTTVTGPSDSGNADQMPTTDAKQT